MRPLGYRLNFFYEERQWILESLWVKFTRHAGDICLFI